MSNIPYYVYDSRGQFIEPLFIVYDEKRINEALQAFGMCGCGHTIESHDCVNCWFKPDWVYVSRMRMHPYEVQDPYKKTSSAPRRESSPSASTVRLEMVNRTLSKRNAELLRDNNELMKRAETTEKNLSEWKSNNMSALKALAVELLTTSNKKVDDENVS